MDPTQCLKELLDLFVCQENEDRNDIVDHLFDMMAWIEKDGFFPTVTRQAYDNKYQIGD